MNKFENFASFDAKANSEFFFLIYKFTNSIKLLKPHLKQFKMLRICARNVQNLSLRCSVVNASAASRGFCEKIEKSESEPQEHAEEKKLSGFAKAFEKHAAPQEEVSSEDKLPDLPFATLLRNSKLVNVSGWGRSLNVSSSRMLMNSQSQTRCGRWIISCFVFLARRSAEQSRGWKNLPCGRRWFVHWLRMEVPLRLHQTIEELDVKFIKIFHGMNFDNFLLAEPTFEGPEWGSGWRTWNCQQGSSDPARISRF